jgi:predicted DNA-binding transcriptional regulator YafY
MNKVERLLNLVAALLEARRPLPRWEVQQVVPGYPDDDVPFRRAFERDKEALRAMGIPLVMEPLDPEHPELGEGYRIPREQYELADPDLAPDELAALHLAATTVRVGGNTGAEALWKLGGAPGEPPAPSAVAALPGGEHLGALFGAISERRTATFGYRGAERRVDPHRLSFRNGFWYLAGFDHARNGDRSFRLDRLDGPPSLGPAGAFERPERVVERQAEPWEMGDEDEILARVLVDSAQAQWVVERASVVERHDDGSVVVEMRVTNRDAFRSFVLGFLDHAEVLGPPELRDDMVAWLTSVAK